MNLPLLRSALHRLAGRAILVALASSGAGCATTALLVSPPYRGMIPLGSAGAVEVVRPVDQLFVLATIPEAAHLHGRTLRVEINGKAHLHRLPRNLEETNWLNSSGHPVSYLVASQQGIPALGHLKSGDILSVSFHPPAPLGGKLWVDYGGNGRRGPGSIQRTATDSTD